MNTKSGITNSTFDFINNLQFVDVYNLEDIQHLQDLFFNSTGVASIITNPEGIPITNPSNFCQLCHKIICKSAKGVANCYQSDEKIGRYQQSDTVIYQCINEDMWYAGASITVRGQHTANWLIGPVRNEVTNEHTMMQHADIIEVDREQYRNALKEVPVMSKEQFRGAVEFLLAAANEISEKDYTNLQLEKQITGRDKEIKSLKDSEKKYLDIFENLNEILYQCDLEGNIIEVSPSVTQLTEFKRNELIGTPLYHLYFNYDDRRVLVNELNNTGEVRDYELKLKTKSGELKYASINARLILDEDNKPNYIIGAIRDVTYRKQTEEVLLERDESYRSLFENMLNGFAYCQMLFKDGQPYDFIYLKVNRAFEQLTGLKNVVGKKVSDVIPGIQKTDENLLKIYGKVALTGKPEFLEMYVESVNEWFSLSIYSPKKEFFIAVFDVITERKHYEQELIKAKEKAEENDRLKTAFLNNISHEIRTPFNGILGFLSIIQDYDLPDNERAEYIGIINQSADRLMKTINDIVEISQIQAGQIKLTVQETNITKLTEELVDRFNSVSDSKGVEFKVSNCLPGNRSTILTDSAKLKTIIFNLIDNAFKFTKAGSIEFGICKKRDFLEFSVNDTGIGISTDRQQVVFERFMQSCVSNTREYEGMGLGLSIAKTYVIMLGGKLGLESEEGKGSKFYFTIPYNAISE